MLKIVFSSEFKRDYKKALKRGYKREKMEIVLNFLVNEQELPQRYRDHALVSNRLYKNVRECHIQPDWLLIYRIEKDIEILRMIRTGTHSDLFKK
ncbi:MAG: type II toxin-antitoxin system YafQ family toxin [Candidatus Saccharibacteria bacterium]|nr:type II toxin-antitoxin system YafQ family toxin [Candidatus Saccharibacteria bacterium]